MSNSDNTKQQDSSQAFGLAQGGASRKILFHRRKNCPFSGKNGQKISYLDTRTLSRHVSERGKMTPSRITAVSAKKQRELSRAIKRARFLALMPYVNK
ncbi:MAG: small subunit ribosomal protein S18 [Alphaproteobacteria bacterium]|jgi:small subunit ribosomal protein S18